MADCKESSKKTIQVVAAIISDGKKILATQRGYGDYKGWWEFPGGKIEQGETPEDALKREMREELNVGIHVEAFFQKVEYDYTEFHLSMACYLCQIKEGEPELREHEAAKWLSKYNINSVRWLPSDIQIIEKIKAEFL